MITKLLNRCKIGLALVAMLTVFPASVYAETAPESANASDASAADALEESGQPLEDSLQSEEQPEEPAQAEEQTDADRLDAISEEINRSLSQEDPEPGIFGEEVEADVSPESIGENGLPEANESTIEVEL
jgi:hypothetical protein